MCGIIAVAGSVGAVEERMFRQLLILDTLRGEDNTGVAAIDRDGGLTIAKCVGDPYQLFDTRQWDDIMKQANRVLIGHNRFATTGKVVRKNAHPFDFPLVVGVHNGTLRSRHHLVARGRYDVDSEQLYHHINDEGIEDFVQKADGAYALVYWDKSDERFCFIRNKERPLFYSLSENGKTIFLASEAWMLSVIFNREGYKHQTIEDVAVDTHYSMDVSLGKTLGLIEVLDIQKEAMKKVEVIKDTIPFQGKRKGYEQGQVGKTVTIKIVNVGNAGASYVEGTDSFNHHVYRIYATPEICKLWMNKLVRGTVTGFCYAGASSSLGFYTIAFASVEVVEVVNYHDITSDLVEETTIVLDHDNKPVSKLSFEYRYGFCAECSGDIAYGDVYKPINFNTC